ncbi:PIN domain-containing protein [Patulibacter brassicae]|uniref:Ribonuclease VapC n=1 Tax=Patulibacter brassicae TaxID=1705717 RepID=A0ABU4VRR3_9ACTN|nr:PIN domain-containing protein [Patulibacter brassicae]MDX8153799.1 PIN domain-containing protein [Patulibacter brassicae]
MTALADTSVWVAAFRRRDDQLLAAAADGDVCVCPPDVLELLVGLPSPGAVRAWRRYLADLPSVALDEQVAGRAAEVVELLAGRAGGQHRATPAPDLLIAACAEVAGVPLLHDDRHFERIAAVTGQDVRRVPA